jgi:hypothetical protein
MKQFKSYQNHHEHTHAMASLPPEAPRPPCLPPEAVYDSREALLQSINAWAALNGCAFVTGRSKRESGKLKVFYTCDRFGLLADVTKTRQRHTTSKRTGCQYSVLAKESTDGSWALKHRPDERYSIHNHELSIHPLAHPVHRVISASERADISDYVAAGLSPKEIQDVAT